jgi:hypothetical protein
MVSDPRGRGKECVWRRMRWYGWREMVQKGRAPRMCRCGVSRLVAEMTPVWLHCKAASGWVERGGGAVGRYKGKRWRQDGVEWNGSNQKGKGTIDRTEPDSDSATQRADTGTPLHNMLSHRTHAFIHTARSHSLARSLARPRAFDLWGCARGRNASQSQERVAECSWSLSLSVYLTS